jgi:hypothetical protein
MPGRETEGVIVTIRAAVNDPNGRTVELTEERWGHIVERHPEIQMLDQTVLRAIQAPDHRMRGRLGNEEWYYVKTDTPSNWLKTVVAYAEGRGHIVTAYARRSMP